MIFVATTTEFDPTAKPGALYGIPRFSAGAGQWLVDWVCPHSGHCEGVTVPDAAQLAWIKANPDEVATMREEFLAWLVEIDDIPF
jgi:hypothetical protein